MKYISSNPTANAAIGAVDKELAQMRKEAARLKALKRQGRLSPAAQQAARRRFTGIYKRLLEEALG